MTDQDKQWFSGQLKQEILASEERVEAKILASEERMVETMRGMQTELLRGFEAFSVVQTLRLRKVEGDQSNLDAAISGRVEVLEGRLHQIEMRLGLL